MINIGDYVSWNTEIKPRYSWEFGLRNKKVAKVLDIIMINDTMASFSLEGVVHNNFKSFAYKDLIKELENE